jgi:hypothetical protein
MFSIYIMSTNTTPNTQGSVTNTALDTPAEPNKTPNSQQPAQEGGRRRRRSGKKTRKTRKSRKTKKGRRRRRH